MHLDRQNRKRRVAALYTQVAADYAELGPPLFAHAGGRLVEIAGVAPADRVLDVATGRGAVLFPAAERIGPSGQVVGMTLGTNHYPPRTPHCFNDAGPGIPGPQTNV